MSYRLAFCVIALAATVTAVLSRSEAQETSPKPAQETYVVNRIENLAFSNDGSALREIQSVSVPTGKFQQLRRITYDAATGSRRSVRDLDPDSYLFSVTSDGRLAVVSVDVDSPIVPAHLLLVDTDTGRAERLPANWFDSDDRSPYAQISGDGHLVSTYSWAGTADRPRYVVKLFDWRAKKLVAEQYTDMNRPFIGISGGGGVTVDGKIAFYAGRSGEIETIVDPDYRQRDSSG